MRFVVDGMLGKLARWLRMLGHDVEYDPNLTDDAILDLAEKDQAVLLTRDEELCRRTKTRGIKGLLVSGNREEVRLAEVAREYSIPLAIDMSMTKCPKCGASLAEVSKLELETRVPPASLKLHNEFWRCENNGCGKIYWRGSHWKQIDSTLVRARKLLEES